MTGKVTAWPKSGRADVPLPRRIRRPCDAGLQLAIINLETQLGTIEAYNRLATAVHALKARIDAGDVKPQNPLYAVSPLG